MATVRSKPNSPYWTAIFRDRQGRRKFKSTKLQDRLHALEVSRYFETLERGSYLSRPHNRIIESLRRARKPERKRVIRLLRDLISLLELEDEKQGQRHSRISSVR